MPNESNESNESNAPKEQSESADPPRSELRATTILAAAWVLMPPLMGFLLLGQDRRGCRLARLPGIGWPVGLRSVLRSGQRPRTASDLRPVVRRRLGAWLQDRLARRARRIRGRCVDRIPDCSDGLARLPRATDRLQARGAGGARGACWPRLLAHAAHSHARPASADLALLVDQPGLGWRRRVSADLRPGHARRHGATNRGRDRRGRRPAPQRVLATSRSS
jgi:hypothetical protein